MLTKPVLSAGILLVVLGCNSNSAPDTSKVAVLDPTVSNAASSNLLDSYTKLDKVYDTDMGPTDAKIAPEEKDLLAKLMDGKSDVKAQLAKDHKLFADGIDTAAHALSDLSNATATNIAPMEHDKYVAYYTAVGERITAHRAEYQAILDFEKKPTNDNRDAVIQAARDAQGKDLTYATKKR